MDTKIHFCPKLRENHILHKKSCRIIKDAFKKIQIVHHPRIIVFSQEPERTTRIAQEYFKNYY